MGALILAMAVLLLFLPVARHGFSIRDDPDYVSRNPLVLQGVTLNAVAGAFTTLRASNWHPITWLSHMTDVQVFGLAPAGHHMSSALLHTLAALLLAWATVSLTGSFAGAMVLAFAWAVHPVRVESVAWVAQRKDVLASLALGALLLAYRHYVDRPSLWRHALVTMVLAVGLTTKPTFVVAPVLLLALDWWPLGRLRRWGSHGDVMLGVVFEKLPLLLLALGTAVLTIRAQQGGGSVVSLATLPLGARVISAVDALVRYLEMTLWPARLAAFYPHSEGQIGASRLLIQIGILCSISLVAVRYARRWPWLAAGWFWYLVAALPVIGFVQVGGQARADRYLTFPILGLLTMILGSAGAWFASFPRRRTAVAIGCAALLGALAHRTSDQIRLWRDDRTLFNHARVLYGESAAVAVLLGMDAMERGDYEIAERELRSAIAYSPAASHLRRRRSWVLERLGRVEEAAEEMARALADGAPDPMAEIDLALLFENLGRYERAIEHYQRADAAGGLPPTLRLRLAQLRAGRGTYQE